MLMLSQYKLTTCTICLLLSWVLVQMITARQENILTLSLTDLSFFYVFGGVLLSNRRSFCWTNPAWRRSHTHQMFVFSDMVRNPILCQLYTWVSIYADKRFILCSCILKDATDPSRVSLKAGQMERLDWNSAILQTISMLNIGLLSPFW